MAAPTVGPSALQEVDHALGRPAAAIASISTMALSGETSEGFQTDVHPAARL